MFYAGIDFKQLLDLPNFTDCSVVNFGDFNQNNLKCGNVMIVV